MTSSIHRTIQQKGRGSFELSFRVRVIIALFVAVAGARLPAQSGTAVVRSMGPFSGRIEGGVHQITASDLLLKDGSVITGSLYVPGSPAVAQIGASPNFGGVVVGPGLATPTNFTVRLQQDVSLQTLVSRTNPIPLEIVEAPPTPSGTRSVIVSTAGEPVGDFTTLRNLAMHNGTGFVAVPEGSYGAFTANSGSGFVLGVSGSSVPVTYNFEQLLLHHGSELRIAGPVVLTVQRGFNSDGNIGSIAHPEWLRLRIFSGGLRIREGTFVYGIVTATSARSDVTVKGTLIGGLTCGQLTVDAGGVVRLTGGNQLPLVDLTAPSRGATYTAPASIQVAATASDVDGSITKVEFFQGGLKLGEDFSAPYQLQWTDVVAGSYSLTARATDNSGGQSTSQPAEIMVTVAPNVAPVISLDLPVANSTFTTPASVTLVATADDSGGTIAKVEYFRDGLLAGTLTAPSVLPSTFSIVDANIAKPGLYYFSARATDNDDAAADSVVVPIRLLPGLPYSVGFETLEGFVGGVLHNQQGWEVPTGVARVTAIDVGEGAQGVVLEPGIEAAEINQEFGARASNPQIVFMDLLAKPATGSSITAGSLFDFDSASVGFLNISSAGQFQVLNGNGLGAGTWVSTSTSVALTPEGVPTLWQRLTVRLHYGTKKWDLYLDGKLVARDLGFRLNAATFVSWFSLKGSLFAPSRFDDLYVGPDNPLFTDADQDGMEDAWELLHRLDPTKDDRDLDGDGDGVSNIEEYLRGTDPSTPPEPDADGDGLSDAQEMLLGTNKLFPDHPDVKLEVVEPARRSSTP